MDKRRLLQIAELVIDANDHFRQKMPNGASNTIKMEISRTPEIYIQAHWDGDRYLNHYRYRAFKTLSHDKTDPHFDAAEHRIRELVEEVRNDTVRDD